MRRSGTRGPCPHQYRHGHTEFHRTLFEEGQSPRISSFGDALGQERRRGASLRPLRRFEFVEIVTTNTTPPSGDRNSFPALWTVLQGSARSEEPQKNAENCGCCCQSAVEALLCFQHVAECGDFQPHRQRSQQDGFDSHPGAIIRKIIATVNTATAHLPYMREKTRVAGDTRPYLWH